MTIKISIDECNHKYVSGWCAVIGSPTETPKLSLYCGERLICDFFTDIYRADVEKALGVNKPFGFKVYFDTPLSRLHPHKITVTAQTNHAASISVSRSLSCQTPVDISDKSKKYIGLYCPNASYRSTFSKVGETLETQSDLVVFYLYCQKIEDDFESHISSMQINRSELKDFDFLDAFVFTTIDPDAGSLPNCPRVHLQHNIFDSPTWELSTHQIIASSSGRDAFLNAYTTQGKNDPNSNLVLLNGLKWHSDMTLIPGGYPKLDAMISSVKLGIPQERNMLAFVPSLAHEKNTDFHLVPKALIKLIDISLDTLSDIEIGIRFHPSELQKNTLPILEKYRNNDRVHFLNEEAQYGLIFHKAFCVVTELSNTAYTFSLATGYPAIFHSLQENRMQENTNIKGEGEFKYFLKARTQVGAVSQNIVDFERLIKKYYQRRQEPLKKILSLAKKEVYNLGQADLNIAIAISKIARGIQDDAWETIHKQ